MSQAPQRDAPLYEGWAALASAVVAIGLAGALIWNSRDFCLDDAWIHLSYAKSLRLGDGLSYNPGDWETGFSSPLWVLLLAAWPTGTDPVIPVKLLGALLHGLTAFFASTLATDLARARASASRPVPLYSIGLLAGVLTASMPTLLQGAVSGMEVALASALVLGAAIAISRESGMLAALAGFAAVLARPESIFFVVGYAAALGVARRRGRFVWAPAGAGIALLAWIAYCLLVTGHPWPNAKYVKASEPGISGLSYLMDQVLPWQPWLIGLGGVAAIALALRQEFRERRFELGALVLAWLGCLLAIALSRPLHPGVLFYESRYFAIVAAIPAVPLALSLVDARRWLALALMVPVALVTSLQIGDVVELVRAQEEDVRLLHTAPARHAADTLPPDATVAVEGAGAMRFFTPRTMTIVDIIGLDDHEIAHAADDVERACLLVARKPEYFVLPEHIAANLGAVFDLHLRRSFEDPSYAQVEERHPMRVLLMDGEVRAQWRERCGGGADR